MKFGSLARRLTAWYVFVAIGLVVMLAGALIIAGLLLYARDANEQIDALTRQIPDIENRALGDHDNWEGALGLLTRRLGRPGFIVRARPPNPPSSPRRSRSVRPSDAPLVANRLGFIAASSLGIRWKPQPFMGGVATIFVDVDRVAAMVEISLAVLVATGILAGFAAWSVGRYITSQALRPLYDVTEALVRFAGRDFTAQPIDGVQRSEFDELVRAYNGAAQQVAAAFAERAAAESQMRQFVADAGHELRTPLTIVLGYIDMLRRRAPDDDRSRRIFETIAIEGTRMRTLIDNLVLLARLEADDTRPVEPFDLTPLLEEDVVRTRLAIAPDRRIELHIGADATVIGERSEIYEAIANIVDNALKYAPDAPVVIAVQAVADGVEITVSDGGPGIDPADRESIFDRFYRGSLRGRVEGSGLGLPIAKRVLERAGGSLRLVSTSPSGSTFAIRLRTDRVARRGPPPATLAI